MPQAAPKSYGSPLFRAARFFAIWIAIGLFTGLLLPREGLAQPKRRGSVAEVKGTVEFFSAAFPGPGWRKVNSGQDLYVGDKVRTGDSADSYAHIDLYNTTEDAPTSAILGPSSDIEFFEPSSETKSRF